MYPMWFFMSHHSPCVKCLSSCFISGQVYLSAWLGTSVFGLQHRGNFCQFTVYPCLCWPGNFRASESTIPTNLMVTPFRPDIVIHNTGTSSLMLFELTCPLDIVLIILDKLAKQNWVPLNTIRTRAARYHQLLWDPWDQCARTLSSIFNCKHLQCSPFCLYRLVHH